MQVDLMHKDLVNLVKGTEPHSSALEIFVKQGFGFLDTIHETWNWDVLKLRNLTEQELLSLYSTTEKTWE